MKDFLKLVLILFVTCAAAAGSLSFINQVTKTPIEEFVKIEKLDAMKKVQEQATDFKEIIKDRLWEAYNGGELVGHVIQSKITGYSGPITLMFGLDPGNAVTAVKVITQTETPGLGAKINTPEFSAQYRAKTMDQLKIKKDDPQNGAIDAITGATISSRAVTNGIRNDLEAFMAGTLGRTTDEGAKQ